MSLSRLLQRKRLIVLGLNSGTSADGLDLAAVRISSTESQRRITFLSGHTIPYGKGLRERVLALADSHTTTLEDVLHLDNLLGQFYGRHAAAYIDKISARGPRIHVVASHGQTVRHIPEHTRIGKFLVNGSMQLGSLDQIAAATGLPVVGEFRQADIALGGEGAPITTRAVQRLLGASQSRLIVNIGGMANYFYLPGEKTRFSLRAGDCGPGNSLSDTLSMKLYGRPFDAGGRLARKGQANQQLLSRLRDTTFFTNRTGSTGREVFGSEMVDLMIKHGKKAQLDDTDLIATAAELTALSIGETIRPLLENDPSLSKLYLTGGGRNNMFIRERIGARLPTLEVSGIDDLGFDGDYVEAASYAIMGEACLRSESLNCATRNGTAQNLSPVLGHVAQPPG